ncbi:MAG: hypothetical protein KIT00_01685 [Rhodospirillales bacterium]|nr:hypothetical protein [Rhodospirillales bacterium]
MASLLALAVALASMTAMARGTSDPYVDGIDKSLRSYHASYGRWPSTLDDLVRHSQRQGRPLNLSAFSWIGFKIHSPQTIYVEFITDEPRRQKMGFAITIREVRP